MPERGVLVIDAGTSSIRCHLFGESGSELASERTAWPPSIAPPELPLAREFCPLAVLDTAHRLIRRTVGESGADVRAVAVTGMRQAVAILGDAGEAIYLGPNVDLRAVFEGAEIDADHAALVHATTGHLPSMLFAPAKLAWLRANRPEDFRKARTAVTLPDWLILRLTGVLASEPTLAAEAGLLDIGRRTWTTELAGTLGVPLDGDVPLVESGQVVGRITSEASRETGLATGTPVVSAGADTQCAALGMAAVETGQVAVVAGWSAPVLQVTDRPMLSPSAATWAGCHLRRDRWVAESSAWDAGRAYAWIAETTGQSFEELEEAAAKLEPGADGTVAVLGPPRMDMSSVGLRLGGLFFPVPLAMGGRGTGHLARAALESITFAIRANLEQLCEVTGLPPSRVAVGGGIAQSGLFGQILANVLDADILVFGRTSASALGAFECAKPVASLRDSDRDSGLHSDREGPAGRTHMVRIRPGAPTASEYQEHYSRWLDLSTALDGVGL